MSSIDLSDACLHIPIHQKSRKYLRFGHNSQVFQFISLRFGLAMAPQVFTMIVKEVKLMALTRGVRLHQYLDGWLIRAPSQKEAQVNTLTMVDPDTVLRVDNKSREVQIQTYSGVFLRGLRIEPGFSPCKTHSREMAQISGFDPTLKVKTCFDCKMFDVTNWVARLNGDGPRGSPLHEAFSVSPQGALEISSVVGHPSSLVSDHFSSPRLVTKSHKRDEGCRPSPQRPQYPNLYKRLNQRLGCSLRAGLYKRSVVRQGKGATHKCSRVEGSISGPEKVQGPVPKPNSIGCYRHLNSSSLHTLTGRNPLSGDVCSPVENHDLVPSLPDNPKSHGI